jgi:hypothetical protein
MSAVVFSASMLLLGLGIAGLAGVRRFRKRASTEKKEEV